MWKWVTPTPRWWSAGLHADKNVNNAHNVQYESNVSGPMAIWLGAVHCLLPACNCSCEPRPQAQHPAGLWNQIFIVHKAAAKYEESALPNKTYSPSREGDKETREGEKIKTKIPRSGGQRLWGVGKIGTEEAVERRTFLFSFLLLFPGIIR